MKLAAAAFCLISGAALAGEVLGTKPTYVDAVPHSFPNQQAITPRIWIPGLEEGWTPQGLAIVGKHAVVTAYQDKNKDRPKCRVFRIELATANDAGSFDMPEPCRHAGGVADIGGGLIVVADTRQDWRVDLEKAIAAGTAEGATRGMVKLGRGFGSAFTFFDGKDLWNGVWVTEAEASEAKIYRVPLATFDRPEPVTITIDNAMDVTPIPALAQGAALDAQANLWIAASEGPKKSFLYRVDRKTGAVQASYQMPSRIENIAFDRDNRLWAISEAGSRKYHNAKDPDFPFIFEIDVARLK
jgi:hypothetical protein